MPLYGGVIQESVRSLYNDVIKYGKKKIYLLQQAGLATVKS